MMYALLEESRTSGFVDVTVAVVLSFALPPRYVEYTNVPPPALTLVRKASKPPPFAI